MKITYKNPTLSQHTPGPWHRNIKPAKKYPIIFAGRNTYIANVYSEEMSTEEMEANANLVRAAPDLLKACVMARSCMRPDDNDATAQALDAAIAKATPEGSG